MSTFSDIFDAAGGLSTDEQETLLVILSRRLTERRRAELCREIQESRAEYRAGEALPASADKIMDEA